MNHQPRLTDDPDDLDRAFAAYFKKQVPTPWPAVRTDPTASASNLHAPATRSMTGNTRSRVTLAASVAALVGLGLYVSSGHRSPQPGTNPASSEPGLIKDSQASGKDLLEKRPPVAPMP